MMLGTKPAGLDHVGSWVSVGCSQVQPYLCISDASPLNHSHTQEPTQPNLCQIFEELGWTAGLYDGFCYGWSNGTDETKAVTWAEAEKACQEVGAHLASVRDNVQQSYLFSRSPEDNGLYWLGYSNLDVRL